MVTAAPVSRRGLSQDVSSGMELASRGAGGGHVLFSSLFLSALR